MPTSEDQLVKGNKISKQVAPEKGGQLSVLNQVSELFKDYMSKRTCDKKRKNYFTINQEDFGVFNFFFIFLQNSLSVQEGSLCGK